MPTLVLTNELNKKLKQPLGELIRANLPESNRALKRVLDWEKPHHLLLIGDAISRTAVQMTIKPDVMIIDGKEKRSRAVEFAHGAANVLRATNPAGTINLDAWKTVEEATRKRDSIIIVDGEEDLLTLVAVMVAPLGSMVVYGQPGEGIVIVRVTSEKKKEVEGIINQMEKRA